MFTNVRFEFFWFVIKRVNKSAQSILYYKGYWGQHILSNQLIRKCTSEIFNSIKQENES